MDRPIIPDPAAAVAAASSIPAHQPWRHPAIKFFTCFFAALGILDFYNSLVL